MLDVSNIAEGARLPALERTIDLPDMIAYAGATWDWHRLHYDPHFVAEKQLPAPVVDGQVFGAYLAEQLLDAFGPRCFIRKLSFRFRSMVFAEETITCQSTVTSVQTTAAGVIVGLEQQVMVGDRVVVAPASAEVIVHE